MMNLQDVIALIRTLKECGATHFKLEDFEVSFSASGSLSSFEAPKAVVAPQQVQTLNLETEAERKARAKIQELVKTMEMSPEQLADKIFPAGVEI